MERRQSNSAGCEPAKRIKLCNDVEPVNINVGGRCFTVSRQVLTSHKDSMLAAMFSGRHQLKHREDGSVFIDRNGEHFHYILSYLRNPDSFIVPDDQDIVSALAVEADFYLLDDLKNKLQRAQEDRVSNIVEKFTDQIKLIDCDHLQSNTDEYEKSLLKGITVLEAELDKIFCPRTFYSIVSAEFDGKFKVDVEMFSERKLAVKYLKRCFEREYEAMESVEWKCRQSEKIGYSGVRQPTSCGPKFYSEMMEVHLDDK